MKKLFLIFTEYPPKFGGMQTHALNMSILLSEKYNITVYTYKTTHATDEVKEFDSSVNFPIRRILSRVSFFNNIQLIHKEVKKNKPDIIYSSTVFYGILKDYCDVPVICRSVGNDMLRPWIIYPFKFGSYILSNKVFENLFNNIKKTINKPPILDLFFIKHRKKLTHRSAQNADLILSNSEYTQDIFKKYNINNSIILSGGVDAQHYHKPKDFDKKEIRTKLGISNECFLMISTGRFVKKKGIDFLINSFIELEKQNKDIELIIIGDGPLKEQLHKQASVTNKICFVGQKSQKEIREYYWVADLYVLGSRIVTNKKTKFQDVETMGRVLCEANAASVPVIASNSGGISTIIKHNYNGLLYETDNYTSFSECFERIYNNKELAERLINNGLIKAKEEFDWSIIAKKHIDFFEKFSYHKNMKPQSSI